MSGRPISVEPAAQDNGLALMLSELIGQNLSDDPDRGPLLERMEGRVAVVAEDAEVTVTLHFSGGHLRVEDGIVGLPDLTVRASTEDVVQMSLVEVGVLGLPNPRGEGFRKLLSAMRTGRVRVAGGLASLPLMTRLTRLVSVAGRGRDTKT
ncbi:MAG: SCP2 sterol-binding domain-containing protein [Myxococcales bacterium]|nr:SCP2 sterol-binding domain-containing protein [Myxococcales bacterium]